ncbi:MAG: DUF881 domain-containing protein [Peptostreptococcaceae bacterium]|nr:DUF881 domain-containing protein [Peptostreptococcaceae bacterium]
MKRWLMKMSNKFYIFIMACIVGLFTALLLSNASSEYKIIPFKLINDYKRVIEIEQVEIKSLGNLLVETKEKIKNIKDEQAKGNVQSLLEQEADEYKAVAGLLGLEGPGVLVLLSDGERELIEGEDPNNLLVHDIDVLNIVNDLKIAGAEAISLNGQRIISVSEINCAGPTIKINDQVYSQPYIIKAIGNSDYLQAAIKAPGTYGNLLKQVGLFVEANTSVSIGIPSYEEPLDYNYMKVVERNDKP